MAKTVFRTFFRAILRVFGTAGGQSTGGQADDYIPSLEFDDGRNSQFLHIIGV